MHKITISSLSLVSDAPAPPYIGPPPAIRRILSVLAGVFSKLIRTNKQTLFLHFLSREKKSPKNMALNLKSRLGLIHTLLFFLFTLATPSLSISDSPTVYEILPQFGLPGGLLPDSVVNYTLSSDDGRFVVVLSNPCYVQFDYLVYYDKTITGKLSYGSITRLKGIQVQRFFLWLDVDEIRVDLPPSDSIYFQVGFINKKLNLGQFKTVHSCRNEVSGPCTKRIFELPTPVNEIEMLLTE